MCIQCRFHEIFRHALIWKFQDPAIRHENGHEASLDPYKGNRKASIGSDEVTTRASSYLGKTVSGMPSSAVQSAITTPNTQASLPGDPNKALPPGPPSMPPLPGAALDASALPPQHGQLIRAAELSADLLVNDASLSDLTDFVRYFLIGKTHPWKEECYIHVVSGNIHTNIQGTGKESGTKLRHEGELNHPCNVAFMDANLNYSAVWRSAPPYPHTEHPSGDLRNQRAVIFLGPQVLYEQPQWRPGERRVETENVCYTFANPNGMIDKVGSA